MKKFILTLLFILLPLTVLSKDFVYEDKNLEIRGEISESLDNVGMYTDLITKLEKTNIQKSKLAELYYQRGLWYEKEYNDTNNALNDFTTAVQYDSKHVKALIASSSIKHKYNDYSGALFDIKKAIEITPNDYTLHFLSGTLYSSLKNDIKAIESYTESIKIKNKNPDSFYYRGLSEIRNGQFNKGLQDLEYSKQQYLEQKKYDKYKKTSMTIEDLKTVLYEQKEVYPTKIMYNKNDSNKEIKALNEEINSLKQQLNRQQIMNNNHLQDILNSNTQNKSNSSIDFWDLLYLTQ